MKKFIIIILVIVTAGALYLILTNTFAENSDTSFEFVEITRGDVKNVISSTGTLSPVTTVDVGTQVSGIIAKVYVDFNDRVRKGQLLAVLDTFLLKSSVMDAEANLDKAKAMLEQSSSEYERNLKLFEKDFISESEFLSFKIGLKNQQANVKSAEASLQRAERNLKYAVISSPINGTVILRNVEEGQTVAASFSTPTLFKIAEDLSNMEILVDVDESDIGLVKEGQKVTFEVQAYSNKLFAGIVKQVRLQPNVVSNVVNYTVVVRAKNEENLLLPGMTATVDFIIENKEDVLLVPRNALRFQPPDDMLAEFRERRMKEMEALPDSMRRGRGFRSGGSPPGEGGNNSERFQRLRDSMGQLWYIDSTGTLQMERVLTGISDGSSTEIVRMRNLTAGSKVISRILTEEEANTSNNSRQPFGAPPPSPGGRRGF